MAFCVFICVALLSTNVLAQPQQQIILTDQNGQPLDMSQYTMMPTFMGPFPVLTSRLNNGGERFISSRQVSGGPIRNWIQQNLFRNAPRPPPNPMFNQDNRPNNFNFGGQHIFPFQNHEIVQQPPQVQHVLSNQPTSSSPDPFFPEPPPIPVINHQQQQFQPQNGVNGHHQNHNFIINGVNGHHLSQNGGNGQHLPQNVGNGQHLPQNGVNGHHQAHNFINGGNGHHLSQNGVNGHHQAQNFIINGGNGHHLPQNGAFPNGNGHQQLTQVTPPPTRLILVPQQTPAPLQLHLVNQQDQNSGIESFWPSAVDQHEPTVHPASLEVDQSPFPQPQVSHNQFHNGQAIVEQPIENVQQRPPQVVQQRPPQVVQQRPPQVIQPATPKPPVNNFPTPERPANVRPPIFQQRPPFKIPFVEEQAVNGRPQTSPVAHLPEEHLVSHKPPNFSHSPVEQPRPIEAQKHFNEQLDHQKPSEFFHQLNNAFQHPSGLSEPVGNHQNGFNNQTVANVQTITFDIPAHNGPESTVGHRPQVANPAPISHLEITQPVTLREPVVSIERQPPAQLISEPTESSVESLAELDQFSEMLRVTTVKPIAQATRRPSRPPQSLFDSIPSNLQGPFEVVSGEDQVPRPVSQATPTRKSRVRTSSNRVTANPSAVQLQQISTDEPVELFPAIQPAVSPTEQPPPPLTRPMFKTPPLTMSNLRSSSAPKLGSEAKSCDPNVCQLPHCFCGGNNIIPGGLNASEVPQMILLTFDDSVNEINYDFYSSILVDRINPNGCPIAATFYLSHEWTDYAKVNKLYTSGHEIASHSISHSDGASFTKDRWTKEIDGQRRIISALGGIKLDDIKGMRAPFLQGGGNRQFRMLYDANFTYDSSIPSHGSSWPYTLDYKMPHDCGIPPCPTRSFPGVWEIPMVMWEDLNKGRCAMADACFNPTDARGVYDQLVKNFKRHYTRNRIPFGMYYHYAWFTKPHHKEGFLAFMDAVGKLPDVYFVTSSQLIAWMQQPTPLSRINDFAPWQCAPQGRSVSGTGTCNRPTSCRYRFKGDERQIPTCQPCPEKYPWLETYDTLPITK